MFFAIAALLIQPAIYPQISFAAEKIVLTQPVEAVSAGSAHSNEPSAVSTIDTSVQPIADSNVVASASAPEAVPASAPAAIILSKSSKSGTVSVGELLAEGRRNQRIWLGLGIASHTAATFDAWSTRRAITAGGQELNPMLKPFAGNASIYAAIQVEPVVMDYLAKKMMYSRHSWVRRMWWVPQSASMVGSLFCGAHNLGVR